VCRANSLPPTAVRAHIQQVLTEQEASHGVTAAATDDSIECVVASNVAKQVGANQVRAIATAAPPAVSAKR
jgi:hypothetical protein